MPSDVLFHDRSVSPGVRLSIFPVFWLGLSITLPIVCLAAWYFFGSDSLGAGVRDRRERGMMLSSLAMVIISHIGILAMLIAELRSAGEVFANLNSRGIVNGSTPSEQQDDAGQYKEEASTVRKISNHGLSTERAPGTPGL